MKRRWKADCDGLLGLRGVRFTGVPMRRSKDGPVVDLRPLVLERLAARAFLQSQSAIRGSEVKVLRTALDLSLEKFARKLGLTSGAIFRWEKSPNQRLTPISEIAVRLLGAEEFGIDLSPKFSQLIGLDHVRVTVQVD